MSASELVDQVLDDPELDQDTRKRIEELREEGHTDTYIAAHLGLG